MEVEYSRGFLKSASRLPNRIIEAADRKELLFRTDPFHPSLETHKLHGKDKEVWSFSVNRKYRIKFLFLGNDRVLFLEIGLHDIYQ